eukprot:s519_g1.t1
MPSMRKFKGALLLGAALVLSSSLWSPAFGEAQSLGGGGAMGTVALCIAMGVIYGGSWKQSQALREAESKLGEVTTSGKGPRIGALDSLRFILIAYIASGHFIHTATKNPFLLRMITQINVVVGAFFVISGYVAAYTTTTLGQRKGTERLDNAVEFVVPRVMSYWTLHMVVLLIFSPMFLYVDVSYSGWPTALWHGFISTFMLQAWFPTSAEVWNAPTWFLSALTFAFFALPYCLRVLATQKKEQLRRTLVILTLLSLVPKIAYSSDLHSWGIMEGMLNAKSHPNYAVFNTLRFSPLGALLERILDGRHCQTPRDLRGLELVSQFPGRAASADLDLDLMLSPAPGSGLSRYKGTGFDPEACGEACEALAEAVAKGNQHQVEGLVTALKLMMPPASGAEQALGPPRDNFILRPEELQWSEQDFLGGLEENQRIVQETGWQGVVLFGTAWQAGAGSIRPEAMFWPVNQLGPRDSQCAEPHYFCHRWEGEEACRSQAFRRPASFKMPFRWADNEEFMVFDEARGGSAFWAFTPCDLAPVLEECLFMFEFGISFRALDWLQKGVPAVAAKSATAGDEARQGLHEECEAKFARLMAKHPEGFRAPEVLAKGLDLAVVYLKNYALDKADALYEVTKAQCLSRGLPWNVKWFQDCATLRCKQNRQAEAAPMLEEVAKLTPPHEATLRRRRKSSHCWNWGLKP